MAKGIALIVVSIILLPGILGAGDLSSVKLGKIPLAFVENQGQMDSEVRFYVCGTDKNLYLTSGGISFFSKGEVTADQMPPCLRLDFVEASENIQPRGEGKQITKFSYFRGGPADWIVDVPAYQKVIYEDLWPSIDFVCTAKRDKLEFEFIIRPGGVPSKIRIRHQDGLIMNGKDHAETLLGSPDACAKESLFYRNPESGFSIGLPEIDRLAYAWKEQVSMPGSVFRSGIKTGIEAGSQASNYLKSQPFAYDPACLVYCGFMGGASGDCIIDITIDTEGNAYMVGATESDETTFPVLHGPGLYHSGDYDVFVAKLSPDGMQLLYCGFIGGNGEDFPTSIAIDSQGAAYIAGETLSSESSFPVTIGPDLTFNGSYEAFVAKVSADGTDLLYCGYIGGGGSDWANDVAVNCEGMAYVAGKAMSDEGSFPVVVGPDLTYNGGHSGDAFVAKVSPDGSHLIYCGYIGGDSDGGDYASGIALDEGNNAYVAGSTYSDESSFPVVVGPDLTYNGGMGDAFVARVNALGTHLDFCGYIGGEGLDQAWAIAVNARGDVCVTGDTNYSQASFPALVGPDLSYNGDRDIFVAMLNTSGISLEYCGYIGGSDNEQAYEIALDNTGCAYITGYTYSDESTFPVRVGPCLVQNGFRDVFVARVNPTGKHLDFCGFIGGTAADWGYGIATNSSGNIYIGGVAGNSSFPTLNGPDLSFNGGSSDAFVAKLSAMTLSSDTYTIPLRTGGSCFLTLTAGSMNACRNYCILGSLSGTSPGIPLPGGQASLPLGWDALTLIVFLSLNTPAFTDFWGVLDEDGYCQALLNAFAPLPSGLVGVEMHFAYTLYPPFDFTSNPVGITFVL